MCSLCMTVVVLENCMRIKVCVYIQTHAHTHTYIKLNFCKMTFDEHSVPLGYATHNPCGITQRLFPKTERGMFGFLIQSVQWEKSSGRKMSSCCDAVRSACGKVFGS